MSCKDPQPFLHRDKVLQRREGSLPLPLVLLLVLFLLVQRQSLHRTKSALLFLLLFLLLLLLLLLQLLRHANIEIHSAWRQLSLYHHYLEHSAYRGWLLVPARVLVLVVRCVQWVHWEPL
jgi:hypothetical protein